MISNVPKDRYEQRSTTYPVNVCVCVCVDVHNACVCIRGLTVQIAHGLICIGFRVTVLVRKKKELLP